jgi:biotin carboxyl carrier protein
LTGYLWWDIIQTHYKRRQKLATEAVEVPIAGKIIDVKVKVGDKVEEGDIVCMLESMKMENPIFAPISGTIKEVNVSAGQTVKFGESIVVIEEE